jgi:hypothetical protein
MSRIFHAIDIFLPGDFILPGGSTASPRHQPVGRAGRR